MIEKLIWVFCLVKKVLIFKYYLKIILFEFFFLEEVLNDCLLGIIKVCCFSYVFKVSSIFYWLYRINYKENNV